MKISVKKTKIWLIELDFTTPFSINFLITSEYYNTFVLNMFLLFDNHEVFQIKIEFFSNHEKKIQKFTQFFEMLFLEKISDTKIMTCVQSFLISRFLVKIPHNFILIHFFISANFIWIMRLNQKSKIKNK